MSLLSGMSLQYDTNAKKYLHNFDDLYPTLSPSGIELPKGLNNKRIASCNTIRPSSQSLLVDVRRTESENDINREKKPIHRESFNMILFMCSPSPLILSLAGKKPITVDPFQIIDFLNQFWKSISTACQRYTTSPEPFIVATINFVIFNVPNKWHFPSFLKITPHHFIPLRTHHFYSFLVLYLQEQFRVLPMVYIGVQFPAMPRSKVPIFFQILETAAPCPEPLSDFLYNTSVSPFMKSL